MDNTQKIRKLQSEIKAMQDANRDAKALIDKINADTEKVKADVAADLEKLKEQIRKDLEELKSFSNPDIYGTRTLELYDLKDRYGINEGGEYPTVSVGIYFGKEVYEFHKGLKTSLADVAIIDTRHTYAPFYRDGVFADEAGEPYSVEKQELDALYRHWPALLVLAYERMLKVYKENATKKLQDALNRKSRALKRQMDIKAALMAATEDN